MLTFEKHIWPFTKYKATYRNILKTTNSFHSEMATFQVKEKASSIELSCNFESERLKYRYIYIYVLISVLYYYIWNTTNYSPIWNTNTVQMFESVFARCLWSVDLILWSVSASVLKEEPQKVSLAPAYSGAHLCPFACGVCCSWVWRRGAVMTACHNTLREACTHRTPKSTPVSRAGNL